MTLENFRLIIDKKISKEFKYNGITYNLTFGKESDGREYISFGRLYEETHYYSYGQFMNQAKIENHFFKEMIDVIMED